MLFRNDEAEELRIKYKYRRLLVQGHISIPYNDAAKLIGPDSAYHLYGIRKIPYHKAKSGPHNNRTVKT